MKKIIALFLVAGVTSSSFISCNRNQPPSQSTESTTETTAYPSSSSSSETLLPEFVDTQIIENSNYDYIVRAVKNGENGEIIGVAVFSWKQEKAAANLIFDSEYILNGSSYPVIQIGVGQGILSFQNQLESIRVPESVRSIEKKAFSFCASLKNVTLSDGLEEIGEMAFWACKALEHVSIPSTVTEIGKNAFAGCENLKSVKIPRRFENQIENIFFGHHDGLTIEYID